MILAFSDQNEEIAELPRDHVVAALEALHQDVPSHIWDDRDLADAYGRHTPMFVLGPERDLSAGELAQRGLRPGALGLTNGATSYRTNATRAPGALIELLYLSNEHIGHNNAALKAACVRVRHEGLWRP